jgi:hypothetical protein
MNCLPGRSLLLLLVLPGLLQADLRIEDNYGRKMYEKWTK